MRFYYFTKLLAKKGIKDKSEGLSGRRDTASEAAEEGLALEDCVFHPVVDGYGIDGYGIEGCDDFAEDLFGSLSLCFPTSFLPETIIDIGGSVEEGAVVFPSLERATIH